MGNEFGVLPGWLTNTNTEDVDTPFLQNVTSTLQYDCTYRAKDDQDLDSTLESASTPHLEHAYQIDA